MMVAVAVYRGQWKVDIHGSEDYLSIIDLTTHLLSLFLSPTLDNWDSEDMRDGRSSR